MRNRISEKLIKGLSLAVTMLLVMVLALCSVNDFSAKSLGNNLEIKNSDALISDISVTSLSDSKTKELISVGAKVELEESATNGSITSDGTVRLFVKMDALNWWTCGTNYNQNFAYFFNSSSNAWSSCAKVYSGTTCYFIVPSGTWSNVILTRNKSTTAGWDVYNQTGDIVLQSDKNYLTSFKEGDATASWSTKTVAPTTYSITPSKTEIKAGETVSFTPTINQTSYNQIKSNSFSVSGGSSSDYSISNSSKTITFNKAGTYTVTDVITYNAIGFTGITGTVTTSAVTIKVNPANPDVADDVTLTAGDARFNGKPITLTASLTGKNDTGSVTYSFSKTSGGSGTFSSTSVSTTSSTASVTFTPSSTGSYTFKVIVSEANHNSIETTLTIDVKTSTWYVHGQWTQGNWNSMTDTSHAMSYDEENGYFYYTKIASVNSDTDKTIYFRLYDGSSQYSGADTNNDTVVPTSSATQTLSVNTSKALKVSNLTGTEMVTVYTDGTYVWYSKTEAVDYNITIDSSITHGTVTCEKTKAKAGETVSLTVTPADGYQLSTLKFNDTSVTGTSFTMPSSDVSITATFTPITYTIKYYVDSSEVTTLTPKTYTVETSTITLPNPAAKTGYTFSGWHSESTTGALTTKIPKGSTGNKSFYGSYVANKYTVTFDADGGSVTPTSKQVTYNSTYGTLPNPTKSGYTFQGWYNGSTQITSSTKVTITSDVTLKAKYVSNPTITVDIMYKGVKDTTKATVTGAGKLAYNGSSTVTVTPADGYYISSVAGSGSSYVVSKDPWSKTFSNVTSDINITVTITDNPTITVKVYYNNQVVTNKATVVGDGKVDYYGKQQTVTVTPNDGYYISAISSSGVSYTAKAGAWTYTFTAKADITVAVYITDNPKVKVKYVDVRTGNEITNGDVAVTIGGKANSSSGVSVTYNTAPQLKANIITANSYKFVGFYNSDGTSLLSSSNPYSLNNVKTNTDVVAKFDKLYKITINFEKLDGLKIDSTTLSSTQLSSGSYNVYYVEGATFEIVTTIEESSEYKLNASCFTPSKLVGEYSDSYKTNVKTKHYNCTVGNQTGSVTIKPVPATYSGIGYWGTNLLTFNLSGFKTDGPYYTITFTGGGSDKLVRLVCIDSTNQVFACPQPTGYTKFVLHRVNPTTGSDWNATDSITIGSKYEYTSNGYSGSKILLK